MFGTFLSVRKGTESGLPMYPSDYYCCQWYLLGIFNIVVLLTSLLVKSHSHVPVNTHTLWENKSYCLLVLDMILNMEYLLKKN